MSKVLVIQFPGVNCEYETLRAIESAGLHGEIRRWNDARSAVADAAAIVIPGGFSYQDRIRAGVVAAKDPVVDAVVKAADRGVPVLGICNGAQILVESGVVPGIEPGSVEVALAPNRMVGRRGYYCAWIRVARGPADCVFTAGLESDQAVPMPVAHAEGRFVTASPDVARRLEAGEGVALRYVTCDGEPAQEFPDNPNGSMMAIAGIANPSGNVLALMPHPERAAWVHQIPGIVRGSGTGAGHRLSRGALFAPGPGAAIFSSLAAAV